MSDSIPSPLLGRATGLVLFVFAFGPTVGFALAGISFSVFVVFRTMRFLSLFPSTVFYILFIQEHDFENVSHCIRTQAVSCHEFSVALHFRSDQWVFRIVRGLSGYVLHRSFRRFRGWFHWCYHWLRAKTQKQLVSSQFLMKMKLQWRTTCHVGYCLRSEDKRLKRSWDLVWTHLTHEDKTVFDSPTKEIRWACVMETTNIWLVVCNTLIIN